MVLLRQKFYAVPVPVHQQINRLVIGGMTSARTPVSSRPTRCCTRCRRWPTTRRAVVAHVAARLGIASFVGSIITIWSSSEIISSPLAVVVAAGFCA